MKKEKLIFSLNSNCEIKNQLFHQSKANYNSKNRITIFTHLDQSGRINLALDIIVNLH